MHSRGLTQAQLARSVGVADTQVSRWRRGQVVPTVQSLQRLADTFGVQRITLDQLVGLPGRPGRPGRRTRARGRAPGPPGTPARGHGAAFAARDVASLCRGLRRSPRVSLASRPTAPRATPLARTRSNRRPNSAGAFGPDTGKDYLSPVIVRPNRLILVPMVVEQSSRGERAYDIFRCCCATASSSSARRSTTRSPT